MNENSNNVALNITTEITKENIPKISIEKPEQLVQSIQEQPAEKTNQRLSLIGIAVTSILFLFVLLMLFKKEEEPPEQSKELVSLENANSIESQEKDNQLAVTEELVTESTLPMIGMSLHEEFDYQPIVSTESTDIKLLKAIEPEMTIAEVSQELAETQNPIIDSDITGKLTIVTSNTTEIDVVFELIQDLQRSSTSKRISGQTDLRRKAIWQLGQTNDLRSIEPLVQIIAQVDSLEKSLILDAITQITEGNLATIDHISSMSLENESAEARQNAVQQLNLSYQSIISLIDRLSEMTETHDIEVRNTARWALQQFERVSLPSSSSDRNLASSNGKFSRI
ncbi:HEAT repeat domain-containing protein [Waterburya agarophytonicola K14]|uniref:HEAT repeat domain-containing protein n=2 Tax=Waterburya TaxID=2886915 RepID=A0A964FGR4_9CYAN|nr:HEAT repeat domain-containing protein [Waterburya agarophytonicola KI4]